MTATRWYNPTRRVEEEAYKGYGTPVAAGALTAPLVVTSVLRARVMPVEPTL